MLACGMPACWGGGHWRNPAPNTPAHGGGVRRFSLASRMGSPEQVEGNTMLALTLKVAGGTWLTAARRA
jgi:hypothetical protein